MLCRSTAGFIDRARRRNPGLRHRASEPARDPRGPGWASCWPFGLPKIVISRVRNHEFKSGSAHPVRHPQGRCSARRSAGLITLAFIDELRRRGRNHSIEHMSSSAGCSRTMSGMRRRHRAVGCRDRQGSPRVREAARCLSIQDRASGEQTYDGCDGSRPRRRAPPGRSRHRFRRSLLPRRAEAPASDPPDGDHEAPIPR